MSTTQPQPGEELFAQAQSPPHVPTCPLRLLFGDAATPRQHGLDVRPDLGLSRTVLISGSRPGLAELVEQMEATAALAATVLRAVEAPEHVLAARLLHSQTAASIGDTGQAQEAEKEAEAPPPASVARVGIHAAGALLSGAEGSPAWDFGPPEGGAAA